MQRSALPGAAESISAGLSAGLSVGLPGGMPDSDAGETGSVVVHVQLRPRRGATRKCLAALAALAAEHDTVPFAVTGLSKDERVVRVTVGIDLGPRAGVAKFSPQAQAAYAFVSAIFASLYDHMPVYTAEPSEEERAAAATLLDASGTRGEEAAPPAAAAVPVPRGSAWIERVSA